ncbi:MAG: T9SS type A sorting domain-containing protein, partial [Chitinophagaceae bacterium]
MKNIFKISVIFFLLIFLCQQSFSQAGTLDPGFGNGGIVINDSFSAAFVSIVRSDGKIIVISAAGGGGTVLWRFNTDGSPDNSFGNNGSANFTFDGHLNNGKAIGIQEDGKIVVTCYYYPELGGPEVDIAVFRCDAAGNVDNSFGTNGLVTINIDILDLVTSLKIQPDGKIALSGDVRKSFFDQKGTFLLRLNADGSMDETFGDAGKVINTYSEYTNNKALIIRPNGKLVTGADYNAFSSHPIYELRSYNTDGSVDNSFSKNGIAQYKFGAGENGTWNTEMSAMTLQTDGKIICTGISGKDETISMALCRFNADGSVDKSFGLNGGIITPYYGEPENRDITLQPDGKILTVGDVQPYITEPWKILLLRYSSDGVPDSSFGENGIATFFVDSVYGQSGQNVHFIADNKILVTGTCGCEVGESHIYLARFNGDEVLAANFKEVKATQTNDAITITWQTLNESSTKSFTVERSSNANDFAGINTVPAKGVASNYSYTDKNPLEGISFYRIRENAANGTNTFSPVVKVVFNDNGVISLYPNPAKNTVTVKGLNKNTTATIRITDMNGREISKQNFTQSSSATLNIRALAQGSYFVLV